MLCERDIEVINSIILDNLEIMQVIEIYYEENYESGNLPLDLPISNYEVTEDAELIDHRAYSFIEPTGSNDTEYSISISNFNKRYAIKTLNASIFKEIDKYVDLHSITEFSLVKTNILNQIDVDLFQSLKNSLKRIDIRESYISEIPKGLFRDLQLETIYLDENAIRKSSADFGLTGILDVFKSFIYTGNIVGNSDKVSIEKYVKNIRAKNVVIKD